MPALKDPKHEAFAQHVAKGMSQQDAYKAAGYKGDRTAASRLSTNVNIGQRIAELTEKAAEKALKAISFEAADMFRDLLEDIRLAHEANDHKTALDGRKFLLRCFGYEDSPTLTHEHVKGSKINTQDRPHEAQEGERSAERENSLVDFADAMKKFRRRTG